MNKPTKRGGARPGAGRKPANTAQGNTIRKTIQLTALEWAQLHRLHAIASQAVRLLLNKEKAQ